MSQQVAEGRELASVATMFPALRFRSLVQDSHRGITASVRLRHHIASTCTEHRAWVAWASAGSIQLTSRRCTAHWLAVHATVV